MIELHHEKIQRLENIKNNIQWWCIGKIKEEIEEYFLDLVDKWHQRPSNLELHEFIGLSWDEHKLYGGKSQLPKRLFKETKEIVTDLSTNSLMDRIHFQASISVTRNRDVDQASTELEKCRKRRNKALIDLDILKEELHRRELISKMREDIKIFDGG